MKILLIDDNTEITDMLSRYLKLENFEVSVSNSGRNGLSLMKTGNFDKILLDLAMPEFSGMQVLEEIHKSNLIDKNKIILFTASSVSQEEIDKMLALGASACIKKPIQMNELVSMLKS